MDIQDDRLYDAVEVADILGIGKSSAYKFIKTGSIRAAKEDKSAPFNTYYVWGSELRRYMEEHGI